jgi:hypothetical protein
VLQEAGPDISNSTVSVPPARRYSNATSHSYLPTAIKPTGSLELGAYMLDATTDCSTPRDKGELLKFKCLYMSFVCKCGKHGSDRKSNFCYKDSIAHFTAF